jgi:hypothetical protein
LKRLEGVAGRRGEDRFGLFSIWYSLPVIPMNLKNPSDRIVRMPGQINKDNYLDFSVAANKKSIYIIQ